MNIILSGYGKMGKEIEKILSERGHSVIAKVRNSGELLSASSPDSLCIDFSTPDAFKSNYKIIADNFSAAVIGTTGWNEIEDEVKAYFKSKNKGLVFGSNFSIGVNICFETAELISKLTSTDGNYDPYIIELHHTKKKDAPSGTAKTFASILEKNFNRKVDAASVRAGNIKGIHTIGFESDYDKIVLHHEAYSRQGFALGSVIAAEWLNEKPCIMNFRELLKLKLKGE